VMQTSSGTFTHSGHLDVIYPPAYAMWRLESGESQRIRVTCTPGAPSVSPTTSLPTFIPSIGPSASNTTSTSAAAIDEVVVTDDQSLVGYMFYAMAALVVCCCLIGLLSFYRLTQKKKPRKSEVYLPYLSQCPEAPDSPGFFPPAPMKRGPDVSNQRDKYGGAVSNFFDKFGGATSYDEPVENAPDVSKKREFGGAKSNFRDKFGGATSYDEEYIIEDSTPRQESVLSSKYGGGLPRRPSTLEQADSYDVWGVEEEEFSEQSYEKSATQASFGGGTINPDDFEEESADSMELYRPSYHYGGGNTWQPNEEWIVEEDDMHIDPHWASLKNSPW